MRRSFAVLVLVFLVGVDSTAWTTPGRSAVLGPEAATAVKRLGSALANALDCQLRGSDLKGPEVHFSLACEVPGPVLMVQMTAPGVGEGPDAVVTRHGALRFPSGVRVPPGLARGLNSLEVSLPWRDVRASAPSRLTYEVDEDRANAVATQRSQALTARVAPRTPPPIPSGPSHLIPGSLAPGDISAWLASRGEGARSPCPEPCLDDELSHLLDPRAQVPSGRILSWIREYRGEAKLWAAAAGAAWSEGDPHGAIAYADVATRLDPQDPDARRVWFQLTSGTSEPPGATMLSDPIGERSLVPPWVWLLGAGALWSLLAWRQRQDIRGTVVVVAGIVVGTLVYGLAPSEPALPSAPPPIPDALQAPLAGGACAGDPALWVDGEWRIYAICSGEPTVFSLGAAGVRASSSRPGPLQAAAVAHLESLWSEKRHEPSAESGAARAGEDGLWSRRDLGEVALCAGIAGSAALALLWLQALFAWGIWQRTREDRALLLGLTIALVLVLVVHIGAPSRMVMTYTGYDLASRLAFLETPPRYGAGAPWLYAPWFSIVGVDHAAVQVANRWMGALTLLPLTYLTITVARGARWAPLLVSLLFASLPVVWRDHTSEGIQTGTTFLVLSALAAWSMTVTRGAARGALLAALPVAALAVVCRPEVAPALVLGALGIWFLPEDSEDDACARPSASSVALSLGCLALVVVPHGLWLIDEVNRLVGEGAIAPVQAGLWDRVMHTVLHDNILVRGPWAPGALSAWLLVGLLLRGPNALACVGLGLAAFSWVGISSVDLPVVSIPRVHLPALLLVLPVIAVGFQRLQELRFANPVLISWLAVASLLSVEPALAPGPGDAEESLIRSALAEVSERDEACVARMGFGDPPAPGKAQRHFPSYLFDGHPVVDLSEIDEMWDRCDGGVVAVLGTRCFLSVSESDSEGSVQETAHPICDEVRDRFRLSPLLEMEVSPPEPTVLRGYPHDTPMGIGVYLLSAP